MLESESWHRGFSLEKLGRRLQSVPLFLLLLPYVLGILLADAVIVPDWVLVVVFVAAVFIVELWGRIRLLSMMAVSVAVLGFGYMTTTLLRPTCDIADGEYVNARVRVDDIPTERDGYRLSHGVIESLQRDSVSEITNYAVLLWIRNDSIREGDVVELHTRFRSRLSRHEAYDRLLRNRGFVGGVGVDDKSIISIEHSIKQRLQNRAIRKLERYMSDSVTHSTVEAMEIGRASCRERV